jgi:hypothetical protein
MRTPTLYSANNVHRTHGTAPTEHSHGLIDAHTHSYTSAQTHEETEREREREREREEKTHTHTHTQRSLNKTHRDNGFALLLAGRSCCDWLWCRSARRVSWRRIRMWKRRLRRG